MTDVHSTEIRSYNMSRIKGKTPSQTAYWQISFLFDCWLQPFLQHFWIPAEMKNSKYIDDIVCHVEVYSIRKSFNNGHSDLHSYNSKLSGTLLYSLDSLLNLINKILIQSFFAGSIPIRSNL